MLAIESAYPLFLDTDGGPLDNGSVYIGVAGQNPITSSQTVYWDAAGTQPAAQPLSTVNGYIARSGTPAAVYVNAAYSVLVKNRTGALVNYTPNAYGAINAFELQQQISDLSSSSVGKGSKLVAWIRRAVGAVATWVEDKLAESVSVKDFGAKCDWNGTTGADDTAAINAATAWAAANNVGIVDVPGRCKTTSPVYLDTGVKLRSRGRIGGELCKTTNTVGTGSNTARSGSKVDSYAVDAIVIIRHGDSPSGTNYAYDCGLIGMTLTGKGPAASDGAIGCDYGVWAPRTSGLKIEGTEIVTCVTGIYTRDSWQGDVTGVTCTACASGVVHEDDGAAVGTGTSMKYHVWCNFDNTRRNPVQAFNFNGLTYSVLDRCACDNLVNTNAATTVFGYNFSTCLGITMNGCGMEASRAGVINAGSSTLTVNNFRTYNLTGSASWGSVAGIFNDASNLTFIGCVFQPYTSPGTLVNMIVQNGANQTEIASTMPSGGSTFISYSSSSQRTVISSGQISVFNSSGLRTALPQLAAITYSTSMTPDVALGNRFQITANNGTAFTINAPASSPASGSTITLKIRNTSGGALGAITWDAVYKQAWVSPATGNSRTIQFTYNGVNWVEDWHSPTDVPN